MLPYPCSRLGIKHRTSARVSQQSLLTQLKIMMTSFDSLPPMGGEGPNAARERTLARDVMEVAVFLSAREGDSDAFQRHMAQVCLGSGGAPTCDLLVVGSCVKMSLCGGMQTRCKWAWLSLPVFPLPSSFDVWFVCSQRRPRIVSPLPPHNHLPSTPHHPVFSCSLAPTPVPPHPPARIPPQLKPFYMDFVSQLPASPNQSAVRGLNLLFLLVENRLAEFHSELELMGDGERASEHVMFPVRLERFLMVGSYDQARDGSGVWGGDFWRGQ